MFVGWKLKSLIIILLSNVYASLSFAPVFTTMKHPPIFDNIDNEREISVRDNVPPRPGRRVSPLARPHILSAHLEFPFTAHVIFYQRTDNTLKYCFVSNFKYCYEYSMSM